MHAHASKPAVIPLYQNWAALLRRPAIQTYLREAAILTVSAEMLSNQITEIYRAWDMSDEVIEVTVRNMIEADLRGIDSHGAGMLPTYNLRRKQGIVHPKGELTVVRDFAATALFDAGNALGHYSTTKAMEMACDKAKQFGVGVVTVRRSNHYGAAGVYSTMAADRGMIGMCMTGSSQPAVLPTFAKEPRFSTNPIAVAAPGIKNEHFSLDMATSTVAVGKLNIARRAGKEIPLGWASDQDGNPTTDPVAALNAVPKKLSPVGGSRELGSHKGYGLGLVVEVLCSVLSGSYTGATDVMTREKGETMNIGHFCLAIDPDAFREEGAFEAQMDGLMDWMRETPPIDPAQPVLVPGDPEHKARKIRVADGIPMTDTLVKEVREVAEESGAPLLIGN
jgi:LDH2 family malate/lactate/ureidoglycolate dehydrogenase